MNARQQYDLFGTMIDLFDGTLPHDEAAQLVARLATDTEAYTLYLRLVRMDVGVEWSFGRRPPQQLVASELAALTPQTEDPTALDRYNRAQANTSRLSSTVLRRSFSRFSRPVLQSAALVALCLYGMFALVAWNLRSGKLPSVAEDHRPSVAVVRDTVDVHWPKNTSSKSAKSSILPGEPLKIESGTLELELNSGTKLTVEGPADWSVDGSNRVSLRAGKLLARVPEQAIGFTVETPTTEIVDLGTEFGVQVDDQGQTDVSVYRGQIELKGKELSVASNVTLRAGQSKRVAKNMITGGMLISNLPKDAVAKPQPLVARTPQESFSRWQKQRAWLVRDPALRLYCDFQEGKGKQLHNLANSDLTAEIHESGVTVWTTGRWPGKHALPIGPEYSYITVASHPALNLDEGNFSLLVSIAFNRLDFTGLIVGRGDWPRHSFSLWACMDRPGHMGMHWSAAPGVAIETLHSISQPEGLRLKTWYQAIATVEGDQVHLYVNGHEVGPPVRFTRPMDRIDTALEIGRTENRWSSPLYALIDEFALFSRALSAEEALAIFELRSPQETNTPK